MLLSSEPTMPYARRDMVDSYPTPSENAIVQSVLEIVESEGYEAVVLREVARRARVSLSTIYKLFPTGQHGLSTREELIVRALELWLVDAYPVVTPPPPTQPLSERVMTMIHYITGPWQRSPYLLQALDRARGGPAEHRLTPKIAQAVEPIRQAAFVGCEDRYAEDIFLILAYVIDALIRQFADGQLEMGDVVAALERIVLRLTDDPQATRRRSRKPRSTQARATGR